MGKSIPNNVFDTDSQYDFNRQIVLTDDGYLVVALGGTYNPALTPIYDALSAIETSNDNILLDTNQLVLNTNDIASETTLNQLLTDFNLEDFASESTLSGLKIVTDNIDLNISQLLTDFNNTDFATEITLSGIKTTTDKLTFTGNDLNVNAGTMSIDTSLLAKETTLQSIDTQTNKLTFIGDRLKVETGSTASSGGGEVTFPDAYFDAFSRVRTSEVTTQIDLKQTSDNLPLYFDEEIIGTGTSVHSITDAHSVLSVTNNNDVVIRQTKMRFNYQSGKSQLIEMTFSNFQTETDVIKELGYFNTGGASPFNTLQDGISLKSDNIGVSININKTGSLTEQTYQTAWNIDKLDGTGISGFTVDWSKGHILIMDFQWLGVGRVRWGLNIGGHIIYFHESNHANIDAGVYMSSPNHSIRYEIRSIGGTGSLNQICCAVGTEGARNKLGTIYTFNTGTDGYNANSNNNKYAMIAFRMKPDYIDNIVDLLVFSLLGSSNDNFMWEFQLNPVIDGGTPTFIPAANSSLEISKLPNNTRVLTDGIILDSGYVEKRTDSRNEIENALRLGTKIDGTTDIGVITLTPLTNGLTVFGSFTRREII